MAGLPKLPISPVMSRWCSACFGAIRLACRALQPKGWSGSCAVLLRTGIALVGLRLTLSGATAIAAERAAHRVICICVALARSGWISRLFAVPARLAVLLAVGTAVCGCTAVIACRSGDPRAQRRDSVCDHLRRALRLCRDAELSLACSTVFRGRPALCGGISRHGDPRYDPGRSARPDLFAAAFAAPAALAAASVAKLLRNLSIVASSSRRPPGCARGQRLAADDGVAHSRAPVQLVPLFVLGFVFCVVLRTVGDALAARLCGRATWNALRGRVRAPRSSF